MAIPIFSNQGKVIGWLDKNIVRNIAGQHVAFINNDNLFDYSSYYLGNFKNGYFRDKFGNAVAFIKGANNGPLTPITDIPPIPPIFPIAPITPIPSIPPIPPLPLLSWSSIDWDEYLKGE